MTEQGMIFNVKEVANFLRISESMIRRLIKEKQIPYFMIARRYLFSRTVIENWAIQQSTVATVPVETDTTEIVNHIWNATKGCK